MREKIPRVSIGLPVRNGQRFLSEALDSLLAQTFSDFEVIVSDNASSDNTETICREYAARDQRIRYHRQARNVGPAPNYNMCFEMSRGEYFRWHAHDDLCDPRYLEKCVEALDRDNTAVLAYPRTLIIDDKGQHLENYEFKIETDAPGGPHRFAELVLVNHRRHRAVEIFGLMRASALRSTPLQGSYARGDSVLLARLSLIGRFVELPERLFLSRSHPSQSMQTLPAHLRNGRSRLSAILGTGPLPPPEWWDSSRRGKINFPEWNLLREYWSSVGLSGISTPERLRCYLVVLEWFMLNLPKLARDVIFAAERLVAGSADTGADSSEAQAA